MYLSYNNEVPSNLESSTKYTEYLKTLSNGGLEGGGGGYYNDSGGRGRGHRRSRRNNLQGSSPLLAISSNEVKFSNIFSPNESNALKLHLLQKTSSLPLLDHSDSDNNARDGAFGNHDSSSAFGDSLEPSSRLDRRRSTAIGLPHENHNSNSNARLKGDPVANIIYSTIRHGGGGGGGGGVATNNSNNNRTNDYDNPSADETLHTGSDSKVDYDPHEPLAPVDQIALRHELLNNIRAISRATYFEDLYTGKVRRHSGSPEAEILRLLGNPESAIENDSAAAAAAAVEENTRERTIPSKDASLSRVDRWVKESSEASAQNNHDVDDDRHASLYHASVWNEKKERESKQKGKRNVGVAGGGVSDATTETDVETASAYNKRPNEPTKFKQSSINTSNNPYTEYDSSSNNKHFTRNTDRTIVSRSMGKPTVPPGIIQSTTSYLHAKYLKDNNSNIYSNINSQYLTVDKSGARRPFSFGVNAIVDDRIPLSVSVPNVAHSINNSYRSTPMPMHASSLKKHSVSRPENLNHSMTNLSVGTTSTRKTNNTTRLDKHKMNAATSHEQVSKRTMAHHAQAQQKPMAQASRARASRITRVPDRGVPGLYSRLNMNQWTVTKVYFYLNGDDLHPRFEYRFRLGKDIRDMDQLLDLLTKRFPSLPMGARHIFTTDGYHISSLDELVHENSYVVSSTRKFKAIKYGNGNESGEGEDSREGRGNKRNGGIHRGHLGLSRKLSASDGNLHRNALFPTSHSFGAQKKLSSLNSKSVSDVPTVVAHVIEEASYAAAMKNKSPLMAREPIRVINGSRPSLQSQVLLNTRTSQPFEDLVKDLALSVRIPKQPVGNCLKTLAGRQIKSYSQLRSELKAGQRAFFVYTENSKPVAAASRPSETTTKYLHTNNGKPIVKAALGKVNSNSSSDLSMITKEGRIKDKKSKPQRRRRSHSPNRSQQQRVNSQYTYSRSPPSPYNFNERFRN